MMKVVLLAPFPNHIASGGIGIWTGRMMKSFPSGDWDIVVVRENYYGKRETYGNNSKKNLLNEIKRCLRIWRDLSHTLKDPEVKIVQSCIPAAFLSMLRESVCAIIAKKFKKRYIVHFHCTAPDFAKGKKEIIMLRILSKMTDLFIVLNNKSKEFVEQKTNKKAIIIPNYIADSEIGTKIAVRNNVSRIIYTGGITEAKGCLDIFEVAKVFPSISFDLFGEYQNTLKEMVKDIPNIHLHGVVSHDLVSKELRNSDIFILLSHSEGFSVSLLEAMSCGLPIVCTNVGANPDMVDSSGGVIVPVSDIEFAKSELRKMMSVEKRMLMSSRNYNKVLHSYSESSVVPMYINAYNSLI